MKHEHQKITVNKLTGRISVETVNTEPTMTQQQYTKECDINHIMEKYTKTGVFTHSTNKQGVYADFSAITDYHDMQNQVTYAQEAFSLLPATLRARFKNDPGELLNFIQDDKNYDEALKLGLLNKKPESSMPTPNDAIQRDEPKGKSKTKLPPIPESDSSES